MPPADGYGGFPTEDPEPADAFEESVEAVGIPAVRVRRPIVHRRRSSNGPALAALGVLLVVAGGLGHAVIGPDGIDRLLKGKGLAQPSKPAKKMGTQQPAPPTSPAGPAVATTAPPAAPRPSAPDRPSRVPEAARQPARIESPPTEPPPRPQPATPPPPPLSEPEVPERPKLDDEARRGIDGALAQALEALRSEDFPRAAKVLAVAADRAAVDADVLDRVSRWQLLAEYARQFPRHRDDALKAAGEGRDYEVGVRKIGVVEVNDQQFVYREKGQNIRLPRNAIPDDILLAIVETWFAGANQAGNHMLLGAYHVTRQRPDLDTARREWSEAARRGEPTGRQLLRLLDDPLLRAATNR